MAKTKAELEAEIKELKAQISDQEKVEQCDKAASNLRRMYDSFINAGFTAEQAWEMLTIQLKGAVQPKRTLF
jgi:hypothetical protein